MKFLVLNFGTTQLRLALRRCKTAEAIAAATPFESTVQMWGKEVFFDCPIHVPMEANARDVVQAGDIAYWTDGSCIAIGFGPTPLSHHGEIRLASPCNIWADAIDDVVQLQRLSPGTKVRVECEHGQEQQRELTSELRA